VIAAILFTSVAGIYLVVRRKDVFTIGLGLALLVASVALFVDHWAWLHE
jgi:hypothetical protein